MDFNLTLEQQQFRDSVRRFIDTSYTFEHRHKIVYSASGVSADAWATMVALGMLALPVPEQQGGFNGSAIDIMMVMHELGRGLVVEPYFATILGTELLKLGGGQTALLEQVAAGQIKLAAALGERQSRHELFDVATIARTEGDGYVINGAKTVVVHGAQADQLVVSARTSGTQRDTAGISLFVIPVATAGVSFVEYRTIDCQRAANITLRDVRIPASSLLGGEGDGWKIVDAGADYGTALLCAEAVGAMEALNAVTLEYLKTRQQFGAPIGRFQVLQHRLADMFMQLEQARSMSMLAAVKASSADVHERRRAVSAAKVLVGQAMRTVGEQAVQSHGGMGVTNETPAAHYFKRLTILELTLGNSAYHLARFVAQPAFKIAA